MEHLIEKNALWKDIKRILMVIIASVIFALNLKSFVRAGGLIPGGFNGLTLLIQEIGKEFFGIKIPFSPLNIGFNAVPLIICYKFVGKKFALLSCLAIFLTSILTDILPSFTITYDILLISIFGGIITGAAACLCLFAGATGGGTDLIAIYFSEKFGRETFSHILAANAIMLVAAGTLFNWEKALYSIIFQFTSTQVLQVWYKRYKKNTLLIISQMPDVVAEVISKHTRHGSTTFTGFGTYEKKSRTLIYSVVGSDEVKKIVAIIKAVDKDVFVNVIKTDFIAGNFYKRPND